MQSYVAARRRELLAGLLFLSPWVVGFAFFQLFPILQSFYYSFTRYNLAQPPEWIGLANYVELFTHDANFLQALSNTVFLTLVGIPLQLGFSLLCAVLLNQRLRGQAFLRTIYIVPTVMPAVAVSILWLWILNPRLGLVNGLLNSIGITGPSWFQDPTWAKPSLILMLCWTSGMTTVVYLAGLQGVPRELYEAARVEGANNWQQIRHVTLPLISPVTLFNLITGLIYAFQLFAEPFTISTAIGGIGRPQGALLFYSIYLYQNAFTFIRMGKAAAMAWILFIIILLVTLVTLRSSRRWAHYEQR